MNTLEIITEMRQNPSLAAELRAVVLSERLLELPEKVASMDDKLEKLIEISKRHESRLSRIEKIAERHETTLAELVEVSKRHESRLSRIEKIAERHEATLAELVEISKRHESRLDRIEKIAERHEATLAELVEISKRHESRLSRIEKIAERHEATLAELVEISKRHESRLDRIEKIAERHEATLAELVEISKRHETILKRYGDDIGQLKGGYFESQWREKATAYLASRGFRQIHLINRGDLDSLLTKAGAEDDFRCDILLADAVHSAIGKDDKVSVYIVAEVSSRIDVNDIERSLRRAELLGQATGGVCVACAVGASIDELAQKLAIQKNVVVVTPTEWNTQAA
ncbi:MAG: hypothetical protein M1483_00570 [Actinobacteria bacterium]|nr:hypothetical protein [Actinomycetota bacterium]MCL6104127.1 hypothetical protein [Actinomycetota bacterium]